MRTVELVSDLDRVRRTASPAILAALNWRPPAHLTYSITQDRNPERPHRAALHSGYRSVWIKFWDREAACSVVAKLNDAALKAATPKPARPFTGTVVPRLVATLPAPREHRSYAQIYP